jgi:ABC-type uncharacterized transport system involved in gliding motility auxiliary subunit
MKQWAPLFGGLGIVGILFGLLSVALLVAGAPTDLGWIFANFLLGLIFLGLWAGSGFEGLRERLSTREARRASTYGTSAIVSTGATLAILALLAFLSTRYEKRFDWSEAGVHSLSEQSRKVLEGLQQDVEVWAFYPPLQQAPVRDLLERYAYVSDRFQVQYADPNARPDLVERFELDPNRLSEGLVRIAMGPESVQVTEVSEEQVTNALVKLTRTGEKKVYFLEGHGERPVTGDESGEAAGFSLAAEALRNENYRFESLLLAARGDVPEDADVVIVAGPDKPLLPEELRALERYVDRGGALLVMVDPGAPATLLAQLERWGVETGDDVVVDLMQGLFGRAATPFAREYAAHPITENLHEVTMFQMARSVRPRADGGGDFVQIVKTSPDSWGETNLELFYQKNRADYGPDDLRGPVSLALAGHPARGDGKAPPPEGEEKEEEAARLVVFGDSDFASNQLIDAYRNRDLFVNAVNWLLGDVEAISIRPQRSRASRLQLSTEQLSDIRYLSLFVLPEAIAVVGVFAWWSRRRAPGR